VAKETREIELKVIATGDAELKALTRQLESVQAEAKKANDQLATIGDTIKGWSIQIKEAAVEKSIEVITESFAKLGEAIKGTFEEAATMSNVSKQIGIAADQLSALRYAGEQTDTPFEAIQKSAGILAKNMADLNGKISPATNALRQLGITAKTDMVTAFEKIADELNKMPEGAEKSARAIQLLGKGGAELIPMLNDGAEGLAKFAAEAQKLGIIWDQKSADQLEEFGDNVAYVKKALEGFVIQLTQAAAPALLALSQVIKDSIPGADTYKKSLLGVSDAIIFVSEKAIDAVATLQSLMAVLKGYRDAFEDILTGIQKGLSKPLDAYTALGTGKGITGAMAAWKADGAASEASFAHAAQSIANGAKASAQIKKDADDTKAALEAAYAKVKAGDPATPHPGGTIDNDQLSKQAAAAKAAKDAAAKALREQQQTEAELEAQRMAGLKASEDYTKQLQDYADKINKAGSPWIQMREDIDQLNKVMATGMITAKGYDAEMKRINDTFQKNIGFTDAMSDEWKRLSKVIEDAGKDIMDMKDNIQKGWVDLGKSLGDTISGLIAHTTKLRDAFQSMVADILKQLLKMAALKIFSSLTGDQQSGFFGQVLKGLGGKAKGAAYENGVEFFASGTVVNSPTPFATSTGIGVMGEAGPEAIVPLTRDTSGNLGVGASPVNVEVHNYGGSSVDVRRTADDRLQIIVQAADYVAKQIRQGGTGVARSIESSYGLGRGAGAFG
jgi:hypothetical protein